MRLLLILTCALAQDADPITEGERTPVETLSQRADQQISRLETLIEMLNAQAEAREQATEDTGAFDTDPIGPVDSEAIPVSIDPEAGDTPVEDVFIDGDVDSQPADVEVEVDLALVVAIEAE